VLACVVNFAGGRTRATGSGCPAPGAGRRSSTPTQGGVRRVRGRQPRLGAGPPGALARPAARSPCGCRRSARWLRYTGDRD
jgi:hypothetical protein